MNFAPAGGFRLALSCLLGLAFLPAASAQFSFTDLSPFFPDGSNLVGLSPDGKTVLGSAPRISVELYEPMYLRDGKVTFLPLGGFGNGVARSMALDGTIVGGVLEGHSEGTDEGAVWRNGQLSLLQHELGGLTTDATGISADGRVIVGSSNAAVHVGRLPARWVDGNVESLGDIPGGVDAGEALAVNGDGSVIVGHGDAYNRAFRWMNGVMEPLPLIGDVAIVESTAVDVSADGRRIVGSQTDVNFDTTGLLWEDGVPRSLGLLPGAHSAFAKAISADGEVVFGNSVSGFFEARAFIWDEFNGMRDLTDVLIDAGVDLNGWSELTSVRDVSADGHTILGYGYDAQGLYSPFIATIPEPGTLSLAAVSFVLLGIRRGRRR